MKNYQDLGGPTPFNYTVDSHQIDLEGLLNYPEKIETVRKVFRKRKKEKEVKRMKEEMSFIGDVEVEKKKRKTGKKVRIKNNKGDFVDIDVPSSDNTPDQDENLIQVGGVVGYEETQLGNKNYDEFVSDSLYSFLVHEEKKRKERSSESRKMKIKKLKQDDSHWRGLN